MGTIYCRKFSQLTPRPLADVPLSFKKRGESIADAKG